MCPLICVSELTYCNKSNELRRFIKREAVNNIVDVKVKVTHNSYIICISHSLFKNTENSSIKRGYDNDPFVFMRNSRYSKDLGFIVSILALALMLDLSSRAAAPPQPCVLEARYRS